MYQVQNTTTNALQQQNLILPDGTIINFVIRYAPLQYGWFLDLSYGQFSLNGLRITNSPNMLFQWKNILPFGLACFSTEGREATQQEDFASGEATLYVLTAAEVQAYIDYLEGQAVWVPL